MEEYKLRIQKHAKISDHINHNDFFQKSYAERLDACKLYNTTILEKTMNGINGVYAFAEDLDGNYIGGYIYGDGKEVDIVNIIDEHRQALEIFK